MTNERIFLWLVAISIMAIIIHEVSRPRRVVETAEEVIDAVPFLPNHRAPDNNGRRFFTAPPVGNVAPVVARMTGAS